MSFRTRRLEPEWMDDPRIEPRQHSGALEALEVANVLSRTLSTLWPPIAELARRNPQKTIRILDVGSGGGDIPLGIVARARKRGLRIEIDGSDLHANSIRFATERAARAGEQVRFFGFDAVKDPIPPGYDLIMCSLFLHHLSDDDAIAFLRKAGESVGSMVLVSDLERGWLGFGAAWFTTRALGLSPVAQKDGPQSVRAAFTINEIRKMAELAGMKNASIRRHWPFRFVMSWRKTG